MERIPQVETSITPEKSREELYFDALEKKRDTLLAFHTMNSFRKNRKPENMTAEEVGEYNTIKEAWQSKKEVSFGALENLSEDQREDLASLGSRLYDVQARLTLLEKGRAPSKAEENESAPDASISDTVTGEAPATEIPASDDLAGETRIRPDESPVPESSNEARPERELAFTLERQRTFAEWPEAGLGHDIKDKVKESYDSAKSGLGKAAESLKSKYRSAKEYVKENTSGLWGWLKERGKGATSFGLWEFHQAERFRSKTGEVAGEVQALSTLIQGEMNLKPDEAETEAWEVMNKLKAAGIEKSSAPEFLEASKDITLRKAKENEQEIEYIIKSAKEDLLEKLGVGKGAFKEYKGEAGQKMLSPENEKKFEDALRLELNKLRVRQGAEDVGSFAKLMRQNLDENWKWRYVWGTAEVALGFIGVKLLTMKIESAAMAKLLAAEKAAVSGAGSGAEQIFTQALNENVWNTLSEMAQNGPQHLNLDNSTLQELSQKVLDANKMYEPEWINNALEGLKSSRTLPQGMPIQIPPEVMKVLGF